MKCFFDLNSKVFFKMNLKKLTELNVVPERALNSLSGEGTRFVRIVQ